jgi:hypothetical protein
MDQTQGEPFILDWDLDVEDQTYFPGSAAVYMTKPEVLIAADLDPTAAGSLITSETSDLFHMLSDVSDTTSISDHVGQTIAYDSDNEDVQQQFVTGAAFEDSATDARER